MNLILFSTTNKRIITSVSPAELVQSGKSKPRLNHRMKISDIFLNFHFN